VRDSSDSAETAAVSSGLAFADPLSSLPQAVKAMQDNVSESMMEIIFPELYFFKCHPSKIL
jgi:hypothetical protein